MRKKGEKVWDWVSVVSPCHMSLTYTSPTLAITQRLMNIHIVTILRQYRLFLNKELLLLLLSPADSDQGGREIL